MIMLVSIAVQELRGLVFKNTFEILRHIFVCSAFVAAKLIDSPCPRVTTEDAGPDCHVKVSGDVSGVSES